MIKEMICIVCPNGCRLTVEETAQGLVIRGNTCPRGEAYGMQEATDPKRVVTAVVRTADPRWPCVPVRTDAPVPKPAIAGLLRELYGLTVALPVRQGDAVLSDFHGSGINVVVTRTLPDPAGEAAP